MTESANKKQDADMPQEAQIKKDHYFRKKYMRRERLYSYVEQIELVKQYAEAEDQVLEIGPGNGFLSHFLNNYLPYTNVTTVDVNPDLKPDIVDDIQAPQTIHEKSYDSVLCFEVLEHMPFEKSVSAVQNLTRIARKYVLISVPDMRYFIALRFGIFGTLPLHMEKLLSTARWRRRSATFGKDHHWEIGVRTENRLYNAGYVRKKLFRNMDVIKDYRCHLVPWHHFYVVQIG